MLTLVITLAIAAVILIGLFLYLFRFNKTHDFKCPNCGEIISLSFADLISSPHMLRKCSVKCPGCGAIVWAVPVRKPQSPIER